MPPSKHSSSSHSSSSRSSSSRSSSSRSSSSRSSSSSSSSSRPSSHSHTSRSSSSFGSRSSFPRSSPRSHASSSKGGTLRIPGLSITERLPKQQPARRPRVNQPVGYVSRGGEHPKHIYGLKHEYIYYPMSWTDSTSGRRYEKGYYDETGQRYDNVSFVKDGRFENVVCRCSYCGLDSVLTLDAEQASAQSLQCPNCGAPMEISSQLDEYRSGSTWSDPTVKGEKASARPAYPPVTRTGKSAKKRRGWLIALAVFAALLILGKLSSDRRGSVLTTAWEAPGQQSEAYGKAAGNRLSLVSSGENSYFVAGEGQTADKQLVWDVETDSYYDAASGCWLWYNTEVNPPVWQYWYDGISSDYGDYGWMEHDFDGWYIEASEGNWIALPSRYDTSELWYLTD